ncbi:hypothetical protein [Roseateles violae]|uniref:Type 4 fimbrial biogenesis protein PilX N-terminal domain-containing protein n=1 Tax=Roseateles violae TaxID=3058042 RepID=A0ABT8DTT0_9BURK|nr:hypothetical protein [Pelomonas sp. PFR6]MDN3921687.1 hypothetical protein [Pelomonas sp. PFR6]
MSSLRMTAGGQRGLATVLALIFLIATVIFVLAQMHNIAGANTVDTVRQSDSTAALFLAESGLEKGRGILNAANVLTDSVCTGMAGSYSLGRGTVTLSAVSTPASCNSGGGTPCTACQLTSTGTVGSATRILSSGLSLNTLSGATCDAATTDCDNTPTVNWKLNLRNPFAVPAVALFNLAALHQGQSSGAVCSAGSACALAWDNSMNGQNSIESMGNIVTIPANGSYAIYQTQVTENLAQVGVLFRGNSAAPTVTGRRTTAAGTLNGAAYWAGGTQQKQPAGSTGTTNDGTATNSNAEVCSDPATASSQSCTSWCYGGDILVLGLASAATALSEDTTAVTFNSSSGNNIAMSSLLNVDGQHKYPSTTSPGPPTNVYSSIWYARNSDYLSAADVYSGARVTGYIGTAFTGSINNNSTSLSITGLTGSLNVGDTIYIGSTPTFKVCTIVAAGSSYTVSSTASCSPAAGANGKSTSVAMGVPSTSLTVTAAPTPGLALGDKIFVIAGTSATAKGTITALGTGTGGTGTYTIDTAQYLASSSLQSDGVNVNTATSATAPVTGTTLALKASTGTGAFATGAGATATKVTGTPTATAYTLSQRPTTPLSNATLCGGTCAFFNKSGSTQFTLTRTLGATQTSWSAGFVCLKGVEVTPEIVQSNKIRSGSWVETIN